MAITLTLLLYSAPLSLLVLFLVKLGRLWHRRKQLQTVLKDFPGPKPHWLYGNTKEVRRGERERGGERARERERGEREGREREGAVEVS